jgi:hypothetical protein
LHIRAAAPVSSRAHSMREVPRNHALQRFGVAGEPRRRILLHRKKQKAAGLPRSTGPGAWAMPESTELTMKLREAKCIHLPRRERRGESASPDAVYRGCNQRVLCAGSLGR